MTPQYHFIPISNPTQRRSSAAKKLAYSHAFRQVHARRRREQTEKYQREVDRGQGIRVVTTFEETVPSPLDHAVNSTHHLLSSLARPLSPIEYFLFNRYINTIIPYTLTHCALFTHPRDQHLLFRDWLSLALTSPPVLVVTVLLSTCRYILHVQPPSGTRIVFARLALQYKQIGLRALRRDVGGGAPGVTTVAMGIALALDEVMLGDVRVARRHLRGMTAVIEAKGGVEGMVLTELVRRMYGKLMGVLGLKGEDEGEDEM